jgi:hypothetical protein
MICSRKAQVSIPKNPKKKKNSQAEQTTKAKLRKQFKDYNITPLNASIHEVLMEVRRDPDYVHPNKSQGSRWGRTRTSIANFMT